ncbi:MAG: hypothetical protein ACTHJN_10790 [Ginsengibacter sp.]
MKTILSMIFMILVSQTATAQQQFYLKKFPANNNNSYITNSPTIKGIVFFYENPKDTTKPVFYIPDFKQSDIKNFEKKQTLYNAKICFPNYKSKPGDFIFSTTSDGKFYYFYDNRPQDKLN